MIMIHSILNLKDIACFIARINAKPSSHVGYAGENAAEIEDILHNEFSDLPLSDSLSVITEGNQILGVIGFDVDIELGQAEIWGPFIDESCLDSHDAVEILWSEGIRKLKGRVHTYNGFYNAKNLQARQFMNKVGAVKRQKEMIWAAIRESAEDRSEESKQDQLGRSVKSNENNVGGEIEPFSPMWTSAFSELHDASFPGTYYDAEAILNRLHIEHKLLIISSPDILYGYIYMEIEENHAEASIEYVAVNPVYREMGVGKRLILHAREALFSQGVDKITLCVSENNEKAHSLYKQCGFQLQYEMLFYQLRM